MTQLVAESYPLDPIKTKKLKSWLTDDGATEAAKVVHAMVAQKMCAVANDKTESALQGQPNQSEAADEALDQIKRLNHFLEVLAQLQGEQQFNLLKIRHEH